MSKQSLRQRLCIASPLLFLLATASVVRGQTATHTQFCTGYSSPGIITVTNTYVRLTGTTTTALVWAPILPSGWHIQNVRGDGGPELGWDGEILFAAPTLPNPIVMLYDIVVPAGVTGKQYLSAYVDHGIDGVIRYEMADPDPLELNQASVGDFVWHDLDEDGVQDAGETGLVNVVVSLHSVTPSGEGMATNWVDSVTTASDGSYRFEEVVAGTYVLGIERPAGYALSPLNSPGGTPATDSDFIPTESFTAAFTLVPGEARLDLDAGLYYNPTLAVITSFRAFVRDGQTVVAWEVADEFDTLGYWIDRRVGDAWLRLNPDAPVWSDFSPWGPHAYELADPGALSGGTYTWRIVEWEGSGRENVYGPYTVTVGGAAADYDAWAAGIDWDDAASGLDDDPDGDGLTNFEEYLAGTNPLDADSLLRVTSLRPAEDRKGLEIRWDSASGRVYAVEYVRTLGGRWLPVQSGIEATPPVNRFVLPGAEGGFFRVVLKTTP